MVLYTYAAEADERVGSYWPSGTTGIFQDESGGGVVGGAAYKTQASAGSTGTGAFTMNGGKQWVAATITIEQASATSTVVSGGAGYVMQSSAGDSGTSTFALTASQASQTLTIAIAPAPGASSERCRSVSENPPAKLPHRVQKTA